MFSPTKRTTNILEMSASHLDMYPHRENSLLAFSNAKDSKRWTSLELQVIMQKNVIIECLRRPKYFSTAFFANYFKLEVLLTWPYMYKDIHTGIVFYILNKIVSSAVNRGFQSVVSQ